MQRAGFCGPGLFIFLSQPFIHTLLAAHSITVTLSLSLSLSFHPPPFRSLPFHPSLLSKLLFHLFCFALRFGRFQSDLRISWHRISDRVNRLFWHLVDISNKLVITPPKLIAG